MTSFVDSNVFIFASTKSEFKDKCRRFLELNAPKVINTLILIEVYTGILKISKNKTYAIKVIKSIMKREDIKIVNFDINLFFETLKRVDKTDIKFNDVAHYVTGLLSGCSGIISYDKDFDNKFFELRRYEHMTVRGK